MSQSCPEMTLLLMTAIMRGRVTRVVLYNLSVTDPLILYSTMLPSGVPN